MSEWSYIVAAYAVTWIGVLGYAVHVARRRARAAARLRDVDATGSETVR